MQSKTLLTLTLTFFIHFVICRDFYVGMFKKNDILVASDNVYKEREPFRKAWAKYGRVFKCPITYFRVVDRLGYGRGPAIRIIRGGLRKNYLVLRMIGAYNMPISVNVYVGCENKMPRTKKTTTPAPEAEEEAAGAEEAKAEDGNATATGEEEGGDAEEEGASEDAGNTTANSSDDTSPSRRYNVETSTFPLLYIH